jgi:hypothetical protein
MEQTFAGAFQTHRRRGCRAQAPGRRAGASERACHPPARGYAVLSPGPAHCTQRSAVDVGRLSNEGSLYVLMCSLTLKMALFDVLPYIVGWSTCFLPMVLDKTPAGLGGGHGKPFEYEFVLPPAAGGIPQTPSTQGRDV